MNTRSIMPIQAVGGSRALEAVTSIDLSVEELAFSPVEFLDAGYTAARFGDIPVLVAPELAAEIRATQAKRQGGAL